jgi:hypothetical protein
MTYGSFALGFLLGAVAGPLLIVTGLSWYVRRRVKNQAYQPPWVPTGAVAPLDWEVQTLDGKTVNLGEHFAGRVAFLNQRSPLPAAHGLSRTDRPPLRRKEPGRKPSGSACPTDRETI